MKLYELTSAYMQVLEMEGIEEDVIKETLESIEEPFNDKVENIVKLIRSIELESESIKSEIDRLGKMKKTRDNKVKNLKEYISNQLNAIEKDEVKGELFNVKMQLNPPKLVVKNEVNIPKEFFEEQPMKLNNKSLKDYILGGGEVDGAEVVREKSLRIR